MSEFNTEIDEEPIAAPATGNLLAPMETRVVELDENSPTDQLLQVLEAIRFYQSNLKTLKEKVEAVMVERIKRDGDIVLGNGVRYYVGTPKTTKCTNVAATLEAIFQATGGDFAAICAVLSSNAIKHGAAKKVLAPDVWAKCFEVKIREKLEGEPAEPTLQKFDERFLR